MMREFDLCAVLCMRMPIDFYSDCAANDNEFGRGVYVSLTQDEIDSHEALSEWNL